jgi:hypothetical protein
MLEKCALISFILIFMFLYLYVKNESFYITISTDNNSQISTQLINEIARVLNIKQNRIANLVYNGDITLGQLNTAFIIKEPNTLSNEKSATDRAILANKLMTNGEFKVIINGLPVVLSKILNPDKNSNNYFDNKGLLTISDYAQNKYNSAPNDESLTKFYTLKIDDDYNIVPKL